MVHKKWPFKRGGLSLGGRKTNEADIGSGLSREVVSQEGTTAQNLLALT